MPLPTNRTIGTGDPPTDYNVVAAQLNKGDFIVFSYSGVLVQGAWANRFRFPFAATLLGVSAILKTPSVGASIIHDVHRWAAGAMSGAGTTIFSTQANRPTIASGAYDAAETVPNTTAMALGDALGVETDQIGTTTAGANVTLIVRFER